MLFQSYVPRNPLCEFVDDFWLYEDYAGVHSLEQILPTGTFEMVFNLREDELRIYSSSEPRECRRFSGAVVSGPSYAAKLVTGLGKGGGVSVAV